MYVTAIKAISPQLTYNELFFEGEYIPHQGIKYLAKEPDYIGLIAPGALRRMGKALRMGIGAGMPLMQQEKDIDAIIVGSSEGGLEDCIKFLNQIVDYNEGSLTPTNFVQSTPNALAGTLAVMTQNSCYNNTHVHRGNAFENALIDMMLLFEENKAKIALVGNVEEISEYNYNIETLAGQFKTEDVSSDDLLSTQTKGTVCGEGASMFVVEREAEDYLAKLIDVDHISFPTKEQLIAKIDSILIRNNMSVADIDVVVCGRNGDVRQDFWYDELKEQLFPTIEHIPFKHLCGDYPTAAGFAMYITIKALSGCPIFSWEKFPDKTRNILIYNHYKGEQHGFILLQKK